MSGSLSYVPNQPRAGVPVTLLWRGAPLASDAIVTSEVQGAETFRVAIKPGPTGELTGEFTVRLPGDYTVTVAGVTQRIHVDPQEDLDFGTEFGVFGAAVLVLLGGMLVWLRKRNNHHPAVGAALSSSPPGSR